MALLHEPFQAVPIQSLVDELRLKAGPDGRTLWADDPDYEERMLEALSRASYPPRSASGVGESFYRRPAFGVASIATGGGAVRFVYLCAGCRSRVLVLFVESPGVLRCRRCLGLKYVPADRSALAKSIRTAAREAARQAAQRERAERDYLRGLVRFARRLGRSIPDEVLRALDDARRPAVVNPPGEPAGTPT